MKKLLHFRLLLSLCCLVACHKPNLQEDEKPPCIPVMELESTDFFVPQDYIANIEAVQYVEVRAKVHGYLEKIYVDEGEQVKKGQPLFSIDDQTYRVAVGNAEASLKQVMAEAKSEELELERLKIMVSKGVISNTELEVKKARKEATLSAVEQAKMILRDVQINLSHAFVRAPFDGVVDRIPLKIGSLIDNGTLLTSISDISGVFAYFKVTENEYLEFMRSQKGNPSEANKYRLVSLILSDNSEYDYQGTVETMEGDFDPETGSIAFRARFKNPDKLIKHGASGKIRMVKKYKDVLLIPQQSTFEIQDKNYVYVLDKDNHVQAKSFVPLQRYKNYYLAKGLDDGERIVYEGLQSMKDGLKINPSRADTVTLAEL